MSKVPDAIAQTGATITVPSRAPEPTVDRIEELAGRILRGDILLPKFQRDFVWEKHQIIDLLDSIATITPLEACCSGGVANSFAVNAPLPILR